MEACTGGADLPYRRAERCERRSTRTGERTASVGIYEYSSRCHGRELPDARATMLKDEKGYEGGGSSDAVTYSVRNAVRCSVADAENMPRSWAS